MQGLVLDIPARPIVEQGLAECVLFLPPFLLEEKHVDKGIRVLKKLLGRKRGKDQNRVSAAVGALSH